MEPAIHPRGENALINPVNGHILRLSFLVIGYHAFHSIYISTLKQNPVCHLLILYYVDEYARKHGQSDKEGENSNHATSFDNLESPEHTQHVNIRLAIRNLTYLV